MLWIRERLGVVLSQAPLKGAYEQLQIAKKSVFMVYDVPLQKLLGAVEQSGENTSEVPVL